MFRRRESHVDLRLASAHGIQVAIGRRKGNFQPNVNAFGVYSGYARWMALDDTSPAVRERMDAAYRRMSAAEKIRRMSALTGLAHSFALARIRAEHPLESERQHRLRLASRFIPRDQLIAAFGWDPEAQP